MNERERLVSICISNFVWNFGSFVNVVFLFFIPAKFSANELQTGIIMSLTSLAIFSGTVIYPLLMKRWSPIAVYKRAVIIGSLAMAIAGLNYDKFWVAIPLTLVGYVTFSLTRGLNKKIISLAISEKERRKVFGYAFALANFGGIFAGILSPFIFNLNVDNMQYLYFVNSISMIIAYLVLSRGVKTVTNQLQVKTLQADGKRIKLDKRLLIGTSGIYLGFFQISYLIPKTVEHYYSMHIYSLSIVINTLICVIIAPVLAKVLTNLNVSEYKSIRTGALLMVISFVLYNITVLPVLIIAVATFTIGEVLFITNLDSYLLKIYRGSDYDHALVTIRIFSQINRTIGPLIASVCIMYASYQTAYLIVGIIIIICLFPLANFQREYKL